MRGAEIDHGRDLRLLLLHFGSVCWHDGEFLTRVLLLSARHNAEMGSAVKYTTAEGMLCGVRIRYRGWNLHWPYIYETVACISDVLYLTPS